MPQHRYLRLKAVSPDASGGTRWSLRPMVGTSVDVFRLGTHLPARAPGTSPRRVRPAAAYATTARTGRTRRVRPHRGRLNISLLDLPPLLCPHLRLAPPL